MGKLVISQIEFHGHCGVTEAERSVGQRLKVDLEVQSYERTSDVAVPISQWDTPDHIIDYQAVTQIVVGIGRETSVCYLETLAQHIASAVLKDVRIQSVLVRVTKPFPPVPEIHDGVSAEVLLTRL